MSCAMNAILSTSGSRFLPPVAELATRAPRGFWAGLFESTLPRALAAGRQRDATRVCVRCRKWPVAGLGAQSVRAEPYAVAAAV